MNAAMKSTMKLADIFSAATMIQLRIIAGRQNPISVLAIFLLAAGILVATIGVTQQKRLLESSRQAVAQQKRLAAERESIAVKAVPVLSQNQQRMKTFYGVLGENGYAEQQLKTLFDIAAKNNLALSEGEYKFGRDHNSAVSTYQIDLPVTGPYPSIRLFCEQALLSIPFASLDEISFKRQAINSASLEAKVRFTLYLSADKPKLTAQR